MPALPLPIPLGGRAYQVDGNGTHDALQVICAWPVSGQYGPGTRVLYYVLIATCLLARRKEWLVNPCLAAALVLPAVAAIHGIVLAVMHNPSAVDMDIFGAFQLCAIGILAAPVTVMMSKTYLNNPGRNTIFVWAFLLLVGLLSMTVEFYRINTVDCTRNFYDEPVSSNASEFPYREGDNCGLTCSVGNGPSSPTRGGSANNIYVIPAPNRLTFGASTLLAAACCIHTILCLVSMWDKVLEINWRRRFGRREPESHDEPISGTNGATKVIMKNINETIGYYLKILAIPVFGGAGLAILIIGEINFFSPQVNYQTEPMANVGQWAPVAGTSLVMLGSLYLLLARDAEAAEKEASLVHHCNCSHRHLDDNSIYTRFSHSESSLPGSHHMPGHGRRRSSSSHEAPQVQPHDSGYRRRINTLFYEIGEFIGTPAEDFIEQPRPRDGSRVDVPQIPGEGFRNPNLSRIMNEQGHQEVEEGNSRSRAASVASSRRVTRSATLPTGEAPQRGQRQRSSTLTNSRPTQLELQSMASSNTPNHARPSHSNVRDIESSNDPSRGQPSPSNTENTLTVPRPVYTSL